MAEPVGGCTLGDEEAKTKRIIALPSSDEAGYAIPKSQMFSTSGNMEFDRALGRLLVHIATVFDVYPGFAYFDDSKAENAYATALPVVPGSSGRGSVLLGVTLMQRFLRDQRDQGIALMGVCAHEFGHIYQMRTGWDRRNKDGQRTVKYNELQADFLAGFFVAERRKRFPGFNLQALGRTFESLGDTDFNSRGHHGTPAQRIAAIEGGYAFGAGRSATVDEAAEAGARLAFSF